MPPTLSDIARACSVSLATASKALNPHADRCDLAADTRERIRAVAAQLGWACTDGRRERARKRSKNIGLMWKRRTVQTDGIYEQVFETVAGTLADRGWRTLLVPVADVADWHSVQMALRIDGAIGMADIDDGVVGELERCSYPIVMVNFRTTRTVHQILSDDAGGAAALARHLRALGHRHVAYVEHRSPFGHYSEQLRPAALAAEGLEITTIPRHDLGGLAAGCRTSVTAVVCYNYRSVPPVIAALREADLDIPGQVSVACCDEVGWLAHLSPPVTAVHVPMLEMSAAAARLVMDLVDGRGGLERLATMPERLIVRSSTGPARPEAGA